MPVPDALDDIMVHVVSSNIAQVGFDDGTLHIWLKTGARYMYRDVPADTYQRLLTAPSIGSFLNREVKGRYKSTPIPICPQCFDAGWVLDAKLNHSPTTLELIPCIYPPCRFSGRAVAILCLYGDWDHPILHPTNGGVMSLSRRAPTTEHPQHYGPQTAES